MCLTASQKLNDSMLMDAHKVFYVNYYGVLFSSFHNVDLALPYKIGSNDFVQNRAIPAKGMFVTFDSSMEFWNDGDWWFYNSARNVIVRVSAMVEYLGTLSDNSTYKEYRDHPCGIASNININVESYMDQLKKLHSNGIVFHSEIQALIAEYDSKDHYADQYVQKIQEKQKELDSSVVGVFIR